MPLILVCRCGAEHDSSEGRLCRQCQADDACAADRAALVTTWRKQQRYLKAGLSVQHIDEQAARIRLRMERRCQQIEQDPDKAHQLSLRQAEMAGQSRSRILLPQEA